LLLELPLDLLPELWVPELWLELEPVPPLLLLLVRLEDGV